MLYKFSFCPLTTLPCSFFDPVLHRPFAICVSSHVFTYVDIYRGTYNRHLESQACNCSWRLLRGHLSSLLLDVVKDENYDGNHDNLVYSGIFSRPPPLPLIRLRQCQQEFQLVPILKDLTLDVTAATFLGGVSEAELDAVRVGFTDMMSALFSYPRRLPWPLSRTPLAKMVPFNFGYGLEARMRVEKAISQFVERRRRQLSSSGKWESTFVADKMLEQQAKQQANGGPAEGEFEIDDDYIVDNVSCLSALKSILFRKLFRKSMCKTNNSTELRLDWLGWDRDPLTLSDGGVL